MKAEPSQPGARNPKPSFPLRLARLFGPSLAVAAVWTGYALLTRSSESHVALPSLFPDGCGICEDLAVFRPPAPLTRSVASGRYTLNIYDSTGPEGGAFEILDSGRRVYACFGHRFWPADLEPGNENPLLAMGNDVTGDGKSNLVIFEWTGGAHAAFYHHVFEIAENLAHIQTISVHDGGGRFADLDGQPGLEFEAPDWSFAYWCTSFADSPAPRIVLRFEDGRYRLAADLMRKPTPDRRVLEWNAKVLRESDRWFISQPAHGWYTLAGMRERLWLGSWKRVGVPIDLWREMLDLIYTGNDDAALEFLNMAWKPGYPGKRARFNEFRSQLAKSPYWPEIREMSRGNAQ